MADSAGAEFAATPPAGDSGAPRADGLRTVGGGGNAGDAPAALANKRYTFTETRALLIERVERAEQERREMYAREAEECALLSEEVLRREWDSPEEDAAWACLSLYTVERCKGCLMPIDLCTCYGRAKLCAHCFQPWYMCLCNKGFTEYTNMQALIDDLTSDDEPDPHAAPTGDLAPGQEREDDA